MLVKDELVTIETPTGPMITHVFLPVLAGRFPGVILWSEIYQVTAPVSRFARLLASEGYLVPPAPLINAGRQTVGSV
jgi:carboxymethylenebutenolidase